MPLLRDKGGKSESQNQNQNQNQTKRGTGMSNTFNDREIMVLCWVFMIISGLLCCKFNYQCKSFFDLPLKKLRKLEKLEKLEKLKTLRLKLKSSIFQHQQPRTQNHFSEFSDFSELPERSELPELSEDYVYIV